jgi:hypothetical protein
MVFYFRLFILIVLLTFFPLHKHAQVEPYPYKNLLIPSQKQVDFRIFIPSKIPADWSLKMIATNDISLHYIDKKSLQLKFGIDESKSYSSWTKDVGKTAEKVKIKKMEGYFQKWDERVLVIKGQDKVKGGLLTWVQEGTLIEMYSFHLSKRQMLKIAKSMK